MKKFLRWTIGLLLVLIALIVAAILSLDTVVRIAAEKRIQVETGMETQIGKLEIGIRSQRLHIENLKLINPPEFGGSTFLDLRELDVTYDLDAFQSNKLVLKNLRVDLAEVHIVQNKDGKQNTDIFNVRLPRKTTAPKESGEKAKPRQKQLPDGLQFGGVEVLDVSLGRAKFSSERHPNQNFDKDLGVKNKVYRDIRNEKDLQAVGTVLLMQVGFTSLLQELLNPSRGNPNTELQLPAQQGK